jgi:uncharacterized protein
MIHKDELPHPNLCPISVTQAAIDRKNMKTPLQAAVLFWIAAALTACAENPPAPPADNGPAHEASVREVLDLTQSQKLVDSVAAQTDSLMRKSMEQALGNQSLTLEQQVILDDERGQVVALIQDQIKWEKMEPNIISLYESSFSEQEIQGMIDFYKSDAGKAVIAKMPVVMQNTMQMVQEQMAALMPKLQQIERDYLTKLKAAKASATQNRPAPWLPAK